MQIRSGRLSLLGALVAIASFWGGTAFALDTDRNLTQYVHRIWQNQIGLPQATISAIWQSLDGYLWLGTQSGVVRFDGVRFTPLETVYPKVPAGIWVRQIVEDARHTVWIGTTESGLIHLGKDNKVERFSTKEGLPTDTLQCLAASRNGDIWACTADGLVRVRDGAIQIFRTEQGLPVNNVRAVCESSDGTVWVGTDSSWLSAWNGTKFVSHPLASIPADAGVRSMLCSDTGGIWVGTTDGLIQLKDGREQLFSVRDGLTDNFIVTLAEGRDGSVYAGTRHGFSRVRKGEIESFRPQDGLSQSIVYSLFEDREGSLWVGTKHGLNQFMDGRAIPYTVSEGLPSNDTGPVLQDDRGRIWVGTLGAGLARFEGHRFRAVEPRQPLASNTVYALYNDPKSGLWVGTERGLNRVVDGQVEQTFTTRQGLPSNSVQSLLKDRSGNLWAGTTAGVAELINGEFIQPPELRAINVPILAMGQNRQRLFFSTERGVYFYGDGKVGELIQDGMPLRNVDAFYQDPDGLLWMGMLGGGLRMLDGDKIVSFPLTEGLFDNDIYGIVRDAQDRLWMACSKGIFSVARSDLRKYAAGDIRRFTSNPYSPTDAQRVVESKPGVQPTVSIMRDCRLWFSTTRGLIVLDPNQQRNTAPPPAVIEEVTVNGESKSPASIAKLEPSQKNLEFRYTGLSFVQPNRVTFRYILEGYDRDWIDAGTRREAFYTNLPPGKFRFRVRACGTEGSCDEAGTSVAFVLLPYFYQRIWFLPACATLLALAGWLVYQLRIRGLREQFSLILAERSRIARELHDTLIQGFSGITMEMQALASRLRSAEDRGSLEDIIRDAGNCLRETRRSVAGLRSPRRGSSRSGLSASIAQAAQQITEAKDIRLKLKLDGEPQSLPADVEYNLLRIAQEAVSNSVKHSGARMVEVALDCTPDVVRLSVKDDGSGFSKDGNGTALPGHYGLIGMKERATQIGADLQLASEPGRGTTVSVVLPADRAVQNTR